MKKIKKIFVLLLLIIVLAGCGMKEEFNLKIEKDKKVGFEVKILMDNEMIDAMLSMSENGSEEEKTYTDEERWKYLDESDTCKTDEGYTCEKITEGNFKGYKMSMKPADIDSVTGNGEKINLTEMNNFNGSLFKKSGDVYSSNFEFKMDSDEGNNYSEYMSQMDVVKISFVVTLPNPSISNNADKVSEDGLTLTWDLSPTSGKSIDFSFKFDPSAKNKVNNNINETNDIAINKDASKLISPITLILIIGCSLLGIVVIVLVIILIAKNSNKKNTNKVEDIKIENNNTTGQN